MHKSSMMQQHGIEEEEERVREVGDLPCVTKYRTND